MHEISHDWLVAGLPIYELLHLRPATDALWTAVAGSHRARGLADVPDSLTRDLGPEVLWTHPDLLLAQACGLPIVTLLDGRVRFVATPVYAVDGCAGCDCPSWLVVTADAALAGIVDP